MVVPMAAISITFVLLGVVAAMSALAGGGNSNCGSSVGSMVLWLQHIAGADLAIVEVAAGRLICLMAGSVKMRVVMSASVAAAVAKLPMAVSFAASVAATLGIVVAAAHYSVCLSRKVVALPFNSILGCLSTGGEMHVEVDSQDVSSIAPCFCVCSMAALW